MARYEHLPIYKATFDLACEAERAVRAFSRYNKYTLGTDLRNRARALVDSVIEANGSTDRARVLKRLRGEIESFKVLVRPARRCRHRRQGGGHDCSGLCTPETGIGGRWLRRNCPAVRALRGKWADFVVDQRQQPRERLERERQQRQRQQQRQDQHQLCLARAGWRVNAPPPPDRPSLRHACAPAGRPYAGHPLFSLGNVYRAWRACRRRKRNTAGAIGFEARLENELVALHEELESGTWEPRPFTAFLVSRHKTLFHARPGCGLPIGNLTSQLFANVTLDALDQHVKHGLRCRWYVRYCDDVVLLGVTREELLAFEESIGRFLRDELELSLDERRRLGPVSDGVDFLGYVVRPDYLLVRRRVVGALKDRLSRVAPPQGGAASPREKAEVRQVRQVQQWLASYHAHLARAASRRLLVSLRRRHGWLDRCSVFRPGRCPRLRYRVVPRARTREWLPGSALTPRETVTFPRGASR